MPSGDSLSATACAQDDRVDFGSLPIHAVFESVAARYPDRTAAVFGPDRVTYATLDKWANAIACDLLERGLQPEDRVGIATPRSIGQVAAVLGVLKAGGAYVPLIANQPAERLSTIAADADCRLIFGDSSQIPAGCSHLTLLDPIAYRDGQTGSPNTGVTASHLAYIMYTSGSTGRPKGVMIEHAGVVRLVLGQSYMPFGPDFHFLYAGPLSFDLSTIEVFTPLLHGAKLIISSEEVLSPQTVREAVLREGLRGICVSFSLFRALFEADPAAFEQLAVIGVCGEPADPRVMLRAQQQLRDASFYNAYGPTECTALTTTHQIPRPTPLDPSVVPIGVPLDRMRVRIVDEMLSDVQPGEIGELLIGGVGLARGYLNDLVLTDARFVRPFSDGSRWYRSGDRVRQLPGGAIAYLGRADDQVKIRGQRIELGEIDAALVRDPAIEAAAAVVLGTGEDARVAACVVPADNRDKSFDPQPVFDRLALRLTRAMMPSLLVPVASMPINQNGKADRDRISRIVSEADKERRGTCSEPAGRVPTGTVELQLASLVGELIGKRVTDLDRTFIQAGGNSLQAMVLAMRLRDRFGVLLTVPQILAAQSLSSLASVIEEGVAAGQTIQHRAVPPSPGRYPMSPAQLRLWTIHQIDPKSAAYNIAYRFEFTREPDHGRLSDAWQRLHDRHPALRTSFSTAEDPTPHAKLVLRVVAEVKVMGVDEDVQRRTREEHLRPFDLSVSPLTRLVVGRDGDQWTGTLVMHHIISDAWSMEVMLRDLSEIYRSIEVGVPDGLAEVGSGMLDPSTASVLKEPEEAIKARIVRAADGLRGLAHTALRSVSGDGALSPLAATESEKMPAELRIAVERFADENECSTHAVLLGLYAAWVGRVIGRSEIAIGLAMSIRDTVASEHDVGFMVETVPIRIAIAGKSTGQIVHSAAEAVRVAQRHRDVPFDLLVAELHDASPAMRTPVTEIFFNLIDPAPITWPLPEHSILRPVCRELDSGLARFDLLGTVYRSDSEWHMSLAVREPTGPEAQKADLRSFFSEAANRLTQPNREIAMDFAKGTVEEAADSDGESDSPVVPGSQEGHVLYTVLSVFREVLGRPNLSENDDFFRLGGNSLKAVRALSMLRDRLGVQVSTVVIFSESTPIKLTRALLKGTFGPGTSPLYRMSAVSNERPILLLPGIEGNLISFAPLVRSMRSDHGFIGLEYPGLHDGSNPMSSVGEISEFFSERIDTHQDVDSHAPAIIGYSFGGVVAYDMAVRYQRAGRAPGPLVLIDSYLPERVPSTSRRERLVIYARAAIGFPTPARIRFIRRRLGGYFRGRSRRRDAIAHRAGPLFDANRAALRSYRAAEPYHGPVLIFRARRPDWMIDHPDDGANGWRSCVEGPLSIVDFDAEHSELLREQFAPQIAQHINDWIRQFD